MANARDGSVPISRKGNAGCEDGNQGPEAKDDGDGEQSGRQRLHPRIREDAAVEHQDREFGRPQRGKVEEQIEPSCLEEHCCQSFLFAFQHSSAHQGILPWPSVSRFEAEGSKDGSPNP